jgi:hypothetical protein
MAGRGSDHSEAPQGAARRRNILSGDDPLHRFLRSRNELSERQRNAVELLLRGLSDQEVAAQVVVDRGTILRWRTRSVAFQRELDRQRRALWEQSAGEIQSMVQPALSILRKQLASDDPKVCMRAAAVLLRFATPSRLVGLSNLANRVTTEADVAGGEKTGTLVDDLIAYVDAPMPGQPGAPEDLVDEEDDPA